MLTRCVRLSSFVIAIAFALPASAELTKEEVGPNTPWPRDNGGTGACDNYRCACGDSCGCGAGCGCGSSTAPDTVRGATFESQNIALLSRVSLADFGPEFTEGNDCWGYTAPSGREYALMGLNSAIGVVEITDPFNPVIVGTIDHPDSPWGDVKTFAEHAFAVNETGGGLQVIDLSQVDNGQVSLLASVDLDGEAIASHNIAINEESGFAYLCGSNGYSGGLVAVYLANPATPVFVGAYTDTYVHDAEVVLFTEGPYAGREIAFCYAGGAGLDIVDVTDKSNMFRMSRTVYPNHVYAHQGWLDRSNMMLYLNDELDERNLEIPVNTRVIDVSNLENPVVINTFSNGLNVVDHNLYARDGFIFEANYRSGVRVFDATGDPTAPVETGWFDTISGPDSTSLDGAWSLFPFFPSGNIILSDIQGGLFVLDPTFAVSGGVPAQIQLVGEAPDQLAPIGQTLDVLVSPTTGFALADTPRLVVNGQSVDLAPLSGDTYSAVFPDLACGEVVEYYFEVEASTGAIVREPLSAPVETFSAIVATDFDTVFEDDVELPSTGWAAGLPEDTATTGAWERAIPNGTDAAPDADSTPTGQHCFVTGNGVPGGGLGNNDVDGGFTTLISPLLDATTGGEPFIEYARWYSNDRGSNPNLDQMNVEISNDDGKTWFTLEIVTDNAGEWVVKRFRIADVLEPTSQMRVRFIASDTGDPSIVEAGIDDLRISDASCDLGCPADFDGSGVVDAGDLAELIAAWGTPARDLDGDGNTEAGDAAVLLAAWGPCQ